MSDRNRTFEGGSFKGKAEFTDRSEHGNIVQKSFSGKVSYTDRPTAQPSQSSATVSQTNEPKKNR